MNVIDALKRLERAGSEDSRVTEKLRNAVTTVAAIVEGQMPEGVETLELPRNYTLSRDNYEVDLNAVLPDDAYGQYRVRLNRAEDTIPRDVAFQFAADVANGWLEEVSELLEKLTVDTQAALEQLETN